MDWLTIVIAAVIGIIFVAIVTTKIINLRRGKHSCSCGGNCGACTACHGAADTRNDGEVSTRR